MLWIWQVRTGMVMLVLGSFPPYPSRRLTCSPHCMVTSLASNRRRRWHAWLPGLWLPYAILLLCVEFHASVGLYRLAIKWGADLWMSRKTMHRIEQVIFWLILVIGGLTLVVLAGWVDPPLAFLLEGTAS